METKRRAKKAALPKAATRDVVNLAPVAEKVDPKWEKPCHALQKLRDSIRNRQQGLLSQAAEESTPIQRNQAELGTDEYDRDWALSMASSEQELLYEIDEALNRIRQGTYGTCELTGQPIEPERLRAVPWTRFSAVAERRLEAEGQVFRTRLGARAELPKEETPATEEPSAT